MPIVSLGIARYFAKQGSKLAILEIAEAKVESLKGEFGGDALICQGDVRSVPDL